MALEKFGKILGDIASTTAKKAGKQVNITRLSLDRAGIEKQIEGIYTAMGRYCYTQMQEGIECAPALTRYREDIDLLLEQIAALDREILQHKRERDAATYPNPPTTESVYYAEPIDVDSTEIVPTESEQPIDPPTAE